MKKGGGGGGGGRGDLRRIECNIIYVDKEEGPTMFAKKQDYDTIIIIYNVPISYTRTS